MSKILYYLCCCCVCPKKVRKGKKRTTKRSERSKKTPIDSKDWESLSKVTPSQIDEKDLTKTLQIPEQFPTLEDCLRAQGLELDFQQRIAKGSFGEVYKAFDLKTGTDIACKRIELNAELGKRDERLTELRNELFIMTKCKRHENIIQVFRHFIVIENDTIREYCYILMEFANGGTLLDRINDRQTKKPKRLTESQAKIYFRQICKGIAFLHMEMGVAHKDLKLNNVLIVVKPNSEEVIKISDFGISKVRYDPAKQVIIKEVVGVGTFEFMSPQVLKIHIYEQCGKKVLNQEIREYNPFKADIWAMGVCLYIMVCADYPFHLDQHLNQYESFEKLYNTMMKQRDRYPISDNTRFIYSFECLDLIDQLLEPSASRRLSIDVVLQHRWLK